MQPDVGPGTSATYAATSSFSELRWRTAVAALGSVAAEGASASASTVAGPTLAEGLPDTRSRAEIAVLLDGLERENALLRQQLDRCFARERDRFGHQRIEAKSASAEAPHQAEIEEAVAARLEVEAQALVAELEGLQQFVLPGAPVEADPPQGGHPGWLGVQATLHRARRATARLRLACEAKLATLGHLHQQLRQRLEEASAVSEGSSFYFAGGALGRGRTTGAPVAAVPPAALVAAGTGGGSTAAGAEVEARLRSELLQAKGEAEEGRAQAAEAALRVREQEEQQASAAKDLDAMQREMRVREAEVRELQLLGKYFAGRCKPPTKLELDAATLAEELRARCSHLTEELDRIRSERDLLRAERGWVDRAGGGLGGKKVPPLQGAALLGATVPVAC